MADEQHMHQDIVQSIVEDLIFPIIQGGGGGDVPPPEPENKINIWGPVNTWLT